MRKSLAYHTATKEIVVTINALEAYRGRDPVEAARIYNEGLRPDLTANLTANRIAAGWAASLEDEVAKALCDTCYGAGAWDSISARPEGAAQVRGWLEQARAAIAVMKRRQE